MTLQQTGLPLRHKYVIDLLLEAGVANRRSSASRRQIPQGLSARRILLLTRRLWELKRTAGVLRKSIDELASCPLSILWRGIFRTLLCSPIVQVR